MVSLFLLRVGNPGLVTRDGKVWTSFVGGKAFVPPIVVRSYLSRNGFLVCAVSEYGRDFAEGVS